MTPVAFAGDLLVNLALLVTLSTVYGAISEWRSFHRPLGGFAAGAVFGGGAVLCMMVPLRLAPGLIYDGRSVVLALAGLFAGPVPTAVAASMAIAYRAWVGGVGLVPGIAAIVVSALFGLAFRSFKRGATVDIPPSQLLVFGIMTHLAVLSLQLLLPAEQAEEVFRYVAPTFLATFSLGTMLLGWLLQVVERRSRRREAELESHLREVERLNRDLAAAIHALRESNQEMEAFTYSVSHDLQAPLRAIDGFAQAILEDKADCLGEDGLEYARRIVAAAERMNRLIQDLLEYSRVSKAAATKKPVPLGPLIDEVLSEMDARLDRARARVDVKDGLPTVLAKRSLLHQAFHNILSNSLKFTVDGKEPRILVSHERTAAGRIRVYVDDNGIGIPLEHRERVFRVFERLHGRERYPGTGIGLAIVRKAVERMGGRCGVEDPPGGKGTRFWIELDGAEEA